MSVPKQWKAAATRIGVPLEEYTAMQLAGMKWCRGCVDFHPRKPEYFGVNRSNPDGLRYECRQSRGELFLTPPEDRVLRRQI